MQGICFGVLVHNNKQSMRKYRIKDESRYCKSKIVNRKKKIDIDMNCI